MFDEHRDAVASAHVNGAHVGRTAELQESVTSWLSPDGDVHVQQQRLESEEPCDARARYGIVEAVGASTGDTTGLLTRRGPRAAVELVAESGC